MTKIISVEEIGLCRSGPNNDIDLQAVFGGIKDRQRKGLKVNPVYDSNHGNTQNSGQDINGNISNVEVVTYTSIPEHNDAGSSDENDHTDSNGNAGVVDQSVSVSNEAGNANEAVSRQEEESSNVLSNQNDNSREDLSNGNREHVNGLDNGNEMSKKLESSLKSNLDTTTKDMKNDMGKNGIVLGVNGIIGKNGGIKRHDILTGNHPVGPKTLTVPVHLGRNKAAEEQVNVVENKNMKNKMLEKRGSGYELLGYNNEGYVADETSVHLDIMNDDDDTINPVDPGKTEKCVLNIEDNETKGNTSQIHSVDPENKAKGTCCADVTISGDTESSIEANEKSNTARSEETIATIAKLHHDVVRTVSSVSSASEQSVKTEIVTEVHVHVHREDSNQNVTHNQDQSEFDGNTDTPVDKKNGESDPKQTQSHDDHNSEMQEVTDHLRVIDDLESQDVVSETQGNNQGDNQCNNQCNNQGNNQGNNQTIAKEHTGEITESLTENNTNETRSNVDENSEVLESTKAVSFCTVEVQDESETNGYKTNTSSTRTLKSILLTSNGKQHTPPESPTSEHKDPPECVSEIHEIKTVKFSEDTVFNENKSKRYKLDKVEKINLRDIYRGKISSDNAVAKMNPIFHDDMEGHDIEKSMSEDEKIAYQIALKKMMKSTGKGKDPMSPAYRDHYLILKANGIRTSADDTQTDIEQPDYDRLIQRTIAKERRKLIVKWVLVILVVAIVTTIATVLGVHFKENG